MSKFYSLLESISPKKTYVGNCVDSFDEDGYCTNDLFYDATDFAQKEEEAETIDKVTFLNSVDIPKHIQQYIDLPTTEYLVIDDHIYTLYADVETGDDIHFFFV